MFLVVCNNIIDKQKYSQIISDTNNIHALFQQSYEAVSFCFRFLT